MFSSRWPYGCKAVLHLYHHVPNKDAILDGVVDAVFAAIALPGAETGDWREAIRVRASSARAVLSRHSWALGLVDSRRSLIDSYIGGFVLQEANLPASEEVAEVADDILAHLPPGEFPYLAEVITGHAQRPGYDHTSEFDYGLDLILDGLEARRK